MKRRTRKSREQKYPNTDTFQYYNHNPKNRITGDCVVRAISFALDEPYNKIVMSLAEIWCETGYDGLCKKGYNQLLKNYGWVKNKQPRKTDGTKFTGKEFCKIFNKGTYICKIGGHHIVTIKDGKVYDIWDSTDGCIGNYWTREED